MMATAMTPEELKHEEFKQEFIRSCERVESKLETYFLDPTPQHRLMEAMRYSLLSGGKRIRPVLVLKFCRAAGGRSKLALPLACAVEIAHTYSLIHDDLPALDDDDFRHGRPTLHKAYEEHTALLAGDALQAAAFGAILEAELEPKIILAALRELSGGLGAKGMCGGQYLDMAGKGRKLTLQQLTNIHERKTGALLRSACCMGVLAAGHPVDSEVYRAAKAYAAAVGMAFQIRDDMLDVMATDEQLGKPAHSDERNSKTTFVTLFGLEECQHLVNQYTDRAKKVIEHRLDDPDFLMWMADEMAGRTF